MACYAYSAANETLSAVIEGQDAGQPASPPSPATSVGGVSGKIGYESGPKILSSGLWRDVDDILSGLTWIPRLVEGSERL